MKSQSPNFKLFKEPRIDSKKSIPPANVALQAGTITLFLTRFLAPIDCLKTPALPVSAWGRRKDNTVSGKWSISLTGHQLFMETWPREEDIIVCGDSNGRRREQRCRFQRKFSRQSYGLKVQYVHFTAKYQNMWVTVEQYYTGTYYEVVGYLCN